MKRTGLIFILWMGMCLFFTGHILAGTEGESNTFYGINAGADIEGNYSATFIGSHAGFSNSTGNHNTFIGREAGFSNTTASHNTFIGRNAGSYNTTGEGNTFIGRSAGYFNSTGYESTFIGMCAGYFNTAGISNTFIGRYAGYFNSTGDDNTFIGKDAGYENTTGTSNTFIGKSAGRFNTTGLYNTFIGLSAGHSNTTGYENTFIGLSAGFYNETGHANVFLGNGAGYNETGSNKLYIDNTNTGSPLIYGEFDNDLVKIHGTLEMAAAATPSDVRMKKNIQPIDASLDKISMLRGVSFNWKTEEYAERGLSDDKQVGLIAQEAEKVLPEIVRTGSDGYKSVCYSKLTAVLVEAVKELKSENEALNDKLEQQLKKQQAEIDALKAILKNRSYYSSLSSKSSICMAAGGAQ